MALSTKNVIDKRHAPNQISITPKFELWLRFVKFVVI